MRDDIGWKGRPRRLAADLGQPVDAASLGVFRIAFGTIMLVEAMRFLAHGWVRQHYLETEFLFTYPGFRWVTPWPAPALHAQVAVIGLCAAMVALGLWYRVAITGLFLTFAYLFLLDQAQYLNQYYLALCLALILCALPAAREFSIEARRRTSPGAPTVPRWSVLALRLQFEVMLLHAGLVKLNADWLRGEPLGLWMSEWADLPLVGPWLAMPGMSMIASHGVILLHLVGAPLLLVRATRFPVFVLYVAFHVISAATLRIGMFSWLTLAGTLMFFDPDWPRQVWSHLSGDAVSGPAAPARPAHPGRLPVATFAALAVFFAFQIAFPLRHLLYPGDVAWTQEGASFSWRMKLDDSRASARFIVTDPASGRRWEVDPADLLGPRQVERMAARPDLILQFAHYLRQRWQEREGVPGVEVRAVVMCSLNGRAPALLVDPGRDLTRLPDPWAQRDWIVPLTVSLERRMPAPRR